MPRIIKLSLLLLPLLAALAILIDTPYHRLSRGELSGVVRVKAMPRPSFDEFWSGQYQSKFEGWLEQHLSFKPAMVRTDNTINLFAFRDISAHSAIPIVLGKDNTLFEMNYVNNTNAVSDVKGDPPPKTDYSLEESTARMGRAARAFRALGVDFMVLLYPSKGWIWRDRLPRRYLLPGGPRKAADGYQRLLRALRAKGVDVIDGAAAYAELGRAQPNLPLYNRGGTHWTDAGACRVAQLVVARLSQSSHAQLRCGLGPPATAHGVDADLASLINVWDNQRFLDPIPSFTASLSEPLDGGPRDALIVGTSFSGQLIRVLSEAQVLGDVNRLVYYRHRDARRFKWKRALQGRSLVIFEQWQWSFLTANLSEFLDDLIAKDQRFAQAYERASR